MSSQKKTNEIAFIFVAAAAGLAARSPAPAREAASRPRSPRIDLMRVLLSGHDGTVTKP